MTKTSYPQTGKTTTDAQFAELFDSIIGTGIRTTGDLVASADSTGLNVKIAPGFAVVNGVAFKSTAVESVPIAANAGTTTRIDTIVLRRDYGQTAVVDLAVHQGAASTTPAAPTLTQDLLGVWEEPIADVVVAAGAATITSANVTDRRRVLSSRVGVWTTTGRPAARLGRFGLNLDSGKWEGYTSSGWANLTPAWSEITGKPDTFPPSAHTHDDRYYTEAETDSKLGGKSNTGHVHDDLYYRRGDVDNALNGKSNNGHTHDDRYYQKGEVDSRLGGKQNAGDYLTSSYVPWQIASGGAGVYAGNDGSARVWSDGIYDRRYTGNGYGGTDNHLMVITAQGTLGVLGGRLDNGYMSTSIPGSYIASSPSFSGLVTANGGITSDDVRARQVTSSYVSVYADGGGRLGYAPSARDTKSEIAPLSDMLTPEQILSIEPKSFVYREDESGTTQIGLIAEDVEDAGIPGLVARNPEGDRIIGLNYEHFVAPLLLVARDLAARVEALESAR